MRILFAFTGGRGHAEPLLPLAEAARAAGHTVAFGGRGSILPVVEERGFDSFATEPGTKPPERLPLQPLDLEREARDFRDGFVLRSRERAPGVLELCRDWQPDVVVGEETHYAALLATERLGLPFASLVVLAAATLGTPELIAEPVNLVRAEQGLPPDPEASLLSRQLVLAPLPPGFRDPAHPLPQATAYFRPFEEVPGPYDGPERVYFTLGTVFNLESGDLFPRVLAGLRKLDAEVIVTVGHGIDPAELGPQPPHVRVEQYVDQRELLPRCAAVVSHAGSGSVLGTVAHGLPAVLLPMGADQPFTAERCAQLGAARVLDPLTATPDDVRAAVTEVLEQPGYRRAAERLRDELARLPGPEHAVELLTALASTRP
jgi:UDP:flavonoid glycosyltransferase YjiC (YdhE family)